MSITKMTKSVKKGFTLLEILLVVGIIAILAGIVILAINPTKQLGDTRNAQRRSDVLTVLNAVYQYSIDNNGVLDEINDGEVIPTTADADNGCTDDGVDVLNLEESLVAASSTYLVEIPHDPLADLPVTDTLYRIVQESSGRLTVCAPEAENSITIKVTR